MQAPRVIHLNVSPVSRGKGAHICAKAAYIESSAIRDERLGRHFCYGSKSSPKTQLTVRLGSRLPDGTHLSTSRLWNAAEAAETKSNARTGRHINMELPLGLDPKDCIELAERYRAFLAKEYHVASTIALHFDHAHNPHAHMLITSREIETGENGPIFGAKTRILDDGRGPGQIDLMRKTWATYCNETLQAPKYTHLSYKRQGIDKTPQIHIGHKSIAAAKKGIFTPRMERAAAIREIKKLEVQREQNDDLIGKCRAVIAEYERHAKPENTPQHREPEPQRPDPEQTQRTHSGTNQHTNTTEPDNQSYERAQRTTGRTSNLHGRDGQPPQGDHEIPKEADGRGTPGQGRNAELDSARNNGLADPDSCTHNPDRANPEPYNPIELAQLARPKALTAKDLPSEMKKRLMELDAIKNAIEAATELNRLQTYMEAKDERNHDRGNASDRMGKPGTAQRKAGIRFPPR